MSSLVKALPWASRRRVSREPLLRCSPSSCCPLPWTAGRVVSPEVSSSRLLQWITSYPEEMCCPSGPSRSPSFSFNSPVLGLLRWLRWDADTHPKRMKRTRLSEKMLEGGGHQPVSCEMYWHPERQWICSDPALLCGTTGEMG